MELSRDFRDDILFRKARAIQQAGNAAQAIQDFQAYLTEYDPLDRARRIGQPRLPMDNPPPDGKHVAMARFRLAESFHQSGNADAARMELEDLLKMINARLTNRLRLHRTRHREQETPAEIRWLTVQTYFSLQSAMLETKPQCHRPAGAASSEHHRLHRQHRRSSHHRCPVVHLANGDLDQAIKACRDYLAAHPVGSRAVRAAWMIAEALQTAGPRRRRDRRLPRFHRRQGIHAFPRGRRHRDGRGTPRRSRHPPGQPEDARALPHRPDPRQQKKHAEAIATWQAYVKDYPNGPSGRTARTPSSTPSSRSASTP